MDHSNTKGFLIRSTSVIQIKAIVDNFAQWLLKEHEALFREHLKVIEAKCSSLFMPEVVLALATQDWNAQVQQTDATAKLVGTGSQSNVAFMLALMPDPVDGIVYGVAYTERMDWYFKFLEHPLVEDYSVWVADGENHGLLNEEWDTRKRVWDRLFGAPDNPFFHSWALHPLSPTAPFSREFVRTLLDELKAARAAATTQAEPGAAPAGPDDEPRAAPARPDASEA